MVVMLLPYTIIGKSGNHCWRGWIRTIDLPY